MKIRPSHHQELRKSAISPELIEANFKSLDNAYGEMLYSRNVPRLNNGRLTQGMMTAYRHLEDGGWYCAGLDAVTLEDSLWGCFKPDRPRLSKEGKTIGRRLSLGGDLRADNLGLVYGEERGLKKAPQSGTLWKKVILKRC